MLLAALLKRMPAKGMDRVVFTEIAKKIVITTVNLVILRRQNGKLQVFLKKRAGDDICWPGMWHIPGTAIRMTDKPGNPIGIGDPMERLQKEEFGICLAREPILLEERFLSPGERGAEITKIYLGEMKGEPTNGRFHEISHLPKNMIRSQISWIRNAVKHFRRIE